MVLNLNKMIRVMDFVFDFVFIFVHVFFRYYLRYEFDVHVTIIFVNPPA
jgi:hypothetical protein